MTAADSIIAPPRSRLKLGLGAAIVLLLLFAAIAVVTSAAGSQGATALVAAPTATSTAGVRVGGTIYIHLLGAVARPGLFTLHEGDRAVDAIAAAGGFTAAADQAQLNLARPLVDGEQIYVPALGEAPPLAIASGTSAGGKVNINTADGPTLETLPRVGPAMAQRILDWRKTNGRFSAIEDLMNVSGIGEKTFDGFKDLVAL